LRAYGQRDPLLEYRKEGTRFFKDLQFSVLRRINEILPNIQPVVVDREEAEMKKQAEAAQAAAGATPGSKPAAVTARAADVPGRNDMVTITNGEKTETMKYKKAEPLLSSGWTIVAK
jgi:preprotein translocase subunit SecA